MAVAAHGSVRSLRSFSFVFLLLLLVHAAAMQAAESQAAVFRKEWQGRRVTVQRMLLTLVYDERGRTGATARGKREGLMVATPSKGSFYLFTGRKEVGDLSSPDPDRLFEMVKTNYQRDRNLGEGYVQIVTPLHLIQYVRGIELVVRRVEIDRSIVRLILFKPESTEEMATALTIEWPAPFSSGFEERGEIERIISQFLAPAPAVP
jgi:hypothetical protein